MRTLLTLALMLMIHAVHGQIVINEIMSSNYSTIPDAEGDFPDWIELYNADTIPINLGGYVISDDDFSEGWTFPFYQMQPGEFLLVFASAKDTLIGSEWHTNFKISLSGEDLMLYLPDQTEIDLFPAVGLWTDASFGRVLDGDSNLSHLDLPSPGSTNAASNTIELGTLPGLYETPFHLNVSSLNPSDTIYYTLDGSIPGPGCLIYEYPVYLHNVSDSADLLATIPTSPLLTADNTKGWVAPEGPVEKGVTFRCITYRNGEPSSRVHSATYFIAPDIHERFPFPIVSLTSSMPNIVSMDSGIYVPGNHFDPTDPDWTGNYFQRGDAWERPVHMEYFSPDGELLLRQNAGMRIHGGRSRGHAQKSLRLYARKEYGNEYFKHDFFGNRPQTQYKRLLLRTASGSWTDDVFKDAFVQFSISHLDIEHQAFQPCIVFLNGEYWGIHTLREVIDEHYLAEYHDEPRDSVDILHGNLFPDVGSADDFLELMEYITTNDISQPAVYEHVTEEIDIDNFIDYHIIQLYAGNWDWPQNNMKMWRPRTPGAKWRWILYDLDSGFGSPWNPSIERILEDDDIPEFYILVFRRLIENTTFRNRFLERFAKHLNESFSVDRMTQLVIDFHEMYGQEMGRHIERWGYPTSVDEWDLAVSRLRYYAAQRPCQVRYHIMQWMNENQFDYDCVPAASESSITIYPNPTSGRFSVHISDELEINGTLVVYNTLGEVVYAEQLVERTSVINFNWEGWKQGVYLISIRSDSGITYSERVLLGS